MSAIKIPLMAEAFEQIKAGRLKLADKYTLTAETCCPARASCERSMPAPW